VRRRAGGARARDAAARESEIFAMAQSPSFSTISALTGRLESTDIPNGEGGESNDKKQFTPWDKHFWGRLKLPDETTDVLGRPLEQQASLQGAGPGAGLLGSSSAVHKVEGEPACVSSSRRASRQMAASR